MLTRPVIRSASSGSDAGHRNVSRYHDAIARTRRDPRLGLSQFRWRTMVARHPTEDSCGAAVLAP
jgi:hypothetical protein